VPWRLLLFLGLLASAPAGAGAAQTTEPDATTTPQLAFVDLVPEFDAFATRTQGMADAPRAAAFRREFAQAIPGFYDPGRRSAARSDARIAAALAAWPNERDAILAVSRRFSAMFAPAAASFRAALGPFQSNHKVYLLHSLGEMDGGTRDLPEGNVLIFGADMIVRYHGDAELTPFFHHELFHVFHREYFGDCPQVWCILWTEGLATYAARQLNPGASDADLLLTAPEPIRGPVDAHRCEAVCTILARLDSTDGADAGAMFSFTRMNPDLPPRFGYYVGLLAAEAMGRDRDLAALARMPQAEVRPALEAALRGLADCPAGAVG
jgi:hypothetical protein